MSRHRTLTADDNQAPASRWRQSGRRRRLARDDRLVAPDPTDDAQRGDEVEQAAAADVTASCKDGASVLAQDNVDGSGVATTSDGSDEAVNETAEGSTGDGSDNPPALGEVEPRRLWRIAMFSLLPAITLLLACATAFFKYEASVPRESEAAGAAATAAARDITIKMLSYQPKDAETKLTAAGDSMAGTFRASYLKLVKDIVAPGAKQKLISATATVPAVAPVAATPSHAVVLVFVNQSIIMATDPPTSTTSVVEVTLDKHRDRWLVTGFEPK